MRYVPRQWPIHAECQATAVRCHHGAFGDARRSHAVVKASEFFDRTSWRICLSKLRLATSGLNLPFRSRNDFRRRSLPAPRPPSSLPSSDQIVCSDPPVRWIASAIAGPVSACFNIRAICPSVCHVSFISSPSSWIVTKAGKLTFIRGKIGRTSVSNLCNW